MKNDTPIMVGDVVTREDGAHFKIMHCLREPFGRFRVLNLATNEVEELDIQQIWVPSLRNKGRIRTRDLEDIDEAEREELEATQKVVEEFDKKRCRTRADAKLCAAMLKRSVRSFYRLWRDYDGTLTSLRRGHSDGGKGKARLGEKAEAILQRNLNKKYDCSVAELRKKIIEQVHKRCDKAEIERISESTILRRLKLIPAKDLARKRYGHVEAENQFGPAAGHYKEATAPFRVIQIDHTPLNLFLIDDETDENIGAAWLTIAIDVFSRMVVGLYLSYEDPNTSSVAVCIYRAVAEKASYLKRLGVEGEWPIWGVMRTIHADNGPDFRTDELTFACREHKIDLQWRPSKNPRYGAHIERLAKTINEEVKKLKGGIPADFKERKHVKPEENGTFSLTDAERYLVTWVTNVYHLTIHKGIGTTPLEKFKQGMLGGDRPVGVPRPIADPKQFYLDLTPCVERTVQRNGIEIDNMVYFERRLEPFILARDPQQPKLARKFRCRTPIDDARKIYFQDPNTKEYHEIRCADLTLPLFNRHELKMVNKFLKDKEHEKIDMVAIKKGIQKLRRLQDEVIAKRGKSRAAASARRKKAINKSWVQNGPDLPHNDQPTPPSAASVPDFKPSDIPHFRVEK